MSSAPSQISKWRPAEVLGLNIEGNVYELTCAFIHHHQAAVDTRCTTKLGFSSADALAKTLKEISGVDPKKKSREKLVLVARYGLCSVHRHEMYASIMIDSWAQKLGIWRTMRKRT